MYVCMYVCMRACVHACEGDRERIVGRKKGYEEILNGREERKKCEYCGLITDGLHLNDYMDDVEFLT